ncbi:hypothetical protein O7614_26815 [Micromonospora sp. WMMD961]|uniref:hypothetical protein n=1 Tax=Micromonospora sp. WMMD961 TaxID=3016100 RepID=UPI002415C24B|nr:hypothetical protein [Micromonospora sp. WMMD961]MDG4783277.1 hypothetical protein [Micromonospora sp. WMMD961]
MTTTTEQTVTAPTGRVAKPVTLERARELLKQAVEARGEGFVYNLNPLDMCYYEPIDQSWFGFIRANDPRAETGCVVGEALALAGEGRHRKFRGSVSSLAEVYGDMLERDAVTYLQRAQREQDKGKTWGEAREAAELVAEELIRPAVEG